MVEDYINCGIGYSILYNGEVVCGVFLYSIYNDGIEIEVVIDYNYRREGLVIVVSVVFILDCLENGKYLNWDVVNIIFVKLVEKLGYEFDKVYDIYFVDNR